MWSDFHIKRPHEDHLSPRAGKGFVRPLLFISSGILFFTFSALSSAIACGQDQQQTVLVHYMPWFASKEVSGQWGWHWKMNRFDPDKIKANGLRDIASHDAPLIGPYDSSDEHLLEYHVQLLKIAGIQGVVIDWYGIADFRDYGMIHRNTERLVKQLKRADLQFAICYEDQSVKHMIEAGELSTDKGITEGTRALKWLAEHLFVDANYIKIQGRPVLLIFGPQYFSKTQWRELASVLPQRPLLFGLPHLVNDGGMDGAFGWPPVSGGREVTRQQWSDYLKQLYLNEQVISVAFPGFKDIYKEAGLHESYGFIDSREGKTLKETLSFAKSSPARILQIATWNDFGEGTVIEPSANHGYRYLEILQQSLSPKSSFSAEDLRLPVRLYQLRKENLDNSQRLAELQRISDQLIQGQCQKARSLIEGWDVGSDK
jgi:hypothetical protein